jgi:hypothetical protein
MWFVKFMCSRTGRVLKVTFAAWLLVEGMGRTSFGGLMMTMTGVVLAVTGMAGACFIEEAITNWAARRTTMSSPQRHHT